MSHHFLPFECFHFFVLSFQGLLFFILLINFIFKSIQFLYDSIVKTIQQVENSWLYSACVCSVPYHPIDNHFYQFFNIYSSSFLFADCVCVCVYSFTSFLHKREHTIYAVQHIVFLHLLDPELTILSLYNDIPYFFYGHIALLLQIYNSEYRQSPIDGHLDCFQSVGITLAMCHICANVNWG